MYDRLITVFVWLLKHITQSLWFTVNRVNTGVWQYMVASNQPQTPSERKVFVCIYRMGWGTVGAKINFPLGFKNAYSLNFKLHMPTQRFWQSVVLQDPAWGFPTITAKLGLKIASPHKTIQKKIIAVHFLKTLEVAGESHSQSYGHQEEHNSTAKHRTAHSGHNGIFFSPSSTIV